MAVLIIGADNLGTALAADLCSRNYSVSIWTHPEHPGNSSTISQDGLSSKGAVTGHFSPAVYSDLGAALGQVKSVLITVPSKAGAREAIITYLGHYDLTDKYISWIPGHLSSVINSHLQTAATFEVSTAPYGCRWENGAIYVKAVKRIVEIASSGILDDGTRNEIEALFPRDVEWRANVLDVALLNTNVIFHPVTVIMNSQRIYDGEDFYFYKDGMTAEVCAKMEEMDATRFAIMQRFNFKAIETIELDNRWYGLNAANLLSFVQTNPSHNATKGVSTNMTHRYLTKDCRILSLFKELAEMFGIDATTIAWVLDKGFELAGEDFNETGITLAKLGMNELDAEEIVNNWGA